MKFDKYYKSFLEFYTETLDYWIKKPKVIIADTVKGKGVSFMENNPDFHGKTANEDQLKEAIKEINSNCR